MNRRESSDQTTFSSFVDGARKEPRGRTVDLVDPSTGMTWAKSVIDDSAVDDAVASALTAFADATWAPLSAFERGEMLRRLGDLIASHAVELGQLDSLANGKTHAATTAEMRATAQWYYYYANALETHDGTYRVLSRTMDAQIQREPLGVVVAITPFNGPLSLGSWKLAPALAMGNVVILKPPAEAPASSIRLAELALKAGFPKGVVNVVIADAPVSEKLATHSGVNMVTFTGSTEVACRLGAKVAAGMKRFVCEAGGKSAHIVFDDADIGSAVIAATQGAFSATGQTCVAGSRVLVHEQVYDDFLDRYVASARRIRVGPPASSSSHIGPVASSRQHARIEAHIAEAVANGARIALGGGRPLVAPGFENGFWIEPTILVDVRSDMRVCREEIFGPVVTVQKFATEEEAIAIANGVDYGLAAGLWSRDINRVRRVSKALQAGTVWVNTYRAINMRVPFGGYKQSGIGRENGVEALDEFSQIKSIVTDYGPAADPFAI